MNTLALPNTHDSQTSYEYREGGVYHDAQKTVDALLSAMQGDGGVHDGGEDSLVDLDVSHSGHLEDSFDTTMMRMYHPVQKPVKEKSVRLEQVKLAAKDLATSSASLSTLLLSSAAKVMQVWNVQMQMYMENKARAPHNTAVPDMTSHKQYAIPPQELTPHTVPVTEVQQNPEHPRPVMVPITGLVSPSRVQVRVLPKVVALPQDYLPAEETVLAEEFMVPVVNEVRHETHVEYRGSTQRGVWKSAFRMVGRALVGK